LSELLRLASCIVSLFPKRDFALYGHLSAQQFLELVKKKAKLSSVSHQLEESTVIRNFSVTHNHPSLSAVMEFVETATAR